jgi:hypothetical protein
MREVVVEGTLLRASGIGQHRAPERVPEGRRYVATGKARASRAQPVGDNAPECPPRQGRRKFEITDARTTRS